MAQYELDQLVKLTATFSTGGTVEDPTAITLSIKKANRPALTYTYPGSAISRLSKGVYEFSVTLDVPGVWKYRWKAAGLVQTSGQRELTVKKADA